jgi:hypothetical protein
VTDRDTVTRILAGIAKKALAQIHERCAEAQKALAQDNPLGAIGALAGLEEQIRNVSTRLMVLREITEIQEEKLQTRRNT